MNFRARKKKGEERKKNKIPNLKVPPWEQGKVKFNGTHTQRGKYIGELL